MKIKYILIIIVSLFFIGCGDDNTIRHENNHVSLLDCEIFLEQKVGNVIWAGYKTNQKYHFGKAENSGQTVRCDKFGAYHWMSTYYTKK